MKLDKFSSLTQELFDRLLVLPIHLVCRHTPDACTQGAIDKAIVDFEEELNKSENAKLNCVIHGRFVDFLKLVVLVYQDGRNCPGPDMMAKLKKLTNDDWKKDRSIIEAGIRTRVIVLEFRDICAMNEWIPPEGYVPSSEYSQ